MTLLSRLAIKFYMHLSVVHVLVSQSYAFRFDHPSNTQ